MNAGNRSGPNQSGRVGDAYPGVTVELLYFRTQAQKIELALHGLDVGFLIGPFEHADFDTRTVLDERLVALLPSYHPLAARQSVSMADPSAMALVLGTMAQWDFYPAIAIDHGKATIATVRAATKLRRKSPAPYPPERVVTSFGRSRYAVDDRPALH